METVRSSLESHLRETWGEPDLAIDDVVPFGDGHSGFTYLVSCVRDVPHRYVVRLSPPNARIAGPADVGRQARIMAALGAAGLPVPRVLSWSSDPVIDGRAYGLMELVAGDRFDNDPAAGSDHELAVKAIAYLRRLHALSPEDVGLDGEQTLTPGGELMRWAGLLDRAPEWLRESGGVLRDALVASAPEPGASALAHGDFHYGNLLFREGAIVAVFDWEIAGLSDPLVDLGCLAVASLRRRFVDEPNPTGGLDIEFDELVALYGADPERAAWFAALSCFKYGAILGYNLQLHLSGKRPDAIYETLLGTMRGLMDDGLDLLDNRPIRQRAGADDPAHSL
jgi:aminoglycoside phosphotransferase (APT) family kinase protein